LAILPSDLPNVKAEFTEIAHIKGTLSAARSSDPDSANSQFFICLESAPHLDRQYSAFGKVIKGMEFVEMIKKGDPSSGAVTEPDKIISLKTK
jgi:cyclophilin family peptidyl-prolyl cis-trans isomerase